MTRHEDPNETPHHHGPGSTPSDHATTYHHDHWVATPNDRPCSTRGVRHTTEQKAAAIFSVAALVILIAGVVLERSGDAIADHIGLTGVLFGATVLADATSLPELPTG